MTGASSEWPRRWAILSPKSRPQIVSVPRGRCGPWPSSEPPTTSTVSYPAAMASRTSVQVRFSSSRLGGAATSDPRDRVDTDEPFDLRDKALRCAPRQLAGQVVEVHHAAVAEQGRHLLVLERERILAGVEEQRRALEAPKRVLWVVHEGRLVHPVVPGPSEQQLHHRHVDQ